MDKRQKKWWDTLWCKSFGPKPASRSLGSLEGSSGYGEKRGKRKPSLRHGQGRVENRKSERDLRKARVTINFFLMPPKGYHRRQRKEEKILLGTVVIIGRWARGLRWILQEASTQPTPCWWTVTGAGLCPSIPTEHKHSS